MRVSEYEGIDSLRFTKINYHLNYCFKYKFLSLTIYKGNFYVRVQYSSSPYKHHCVSLSLCVLPSTTYIKY